MAPSRSASHRFLNAAVSERDSPVRPRSRTRASNSSSPTIEASSASGRRDDKSSWPVRAISVNSLCRLGMAEVERAAKRGDQVRIGHCLLPNVLFTSVVDPAAGWMQHIAWRVPVENDSSVSFVVDQVRLSGAELERYLTTARERHQKLVGLPSPDDVGRAILRGELSLDDVGQRSDLLNIQDVVALVGQEGAFRARDRLGRSDVSVVLLRRIFAREIRLLSEGKPTKQWLWPEDLCVTTRPASDFSISKG